MILYRALQPLLLATFKSLALLLKHLPVVKDRTKKLWTTFDMRYVDGAPAFLKIDPAAFGKARPIWIHAASGEFEYAKPVIRELARGDSPVLVTYFSPTFAENVHSFSGVTAACPLPLDSRDELEGFLTHLNPKALLIARTDAWPNTVLATSERRIPILLFSTTFHGQSNRMRRPGRRLTVDTLKLIDEIQCVSDDDRDLLKSIGITKVETCGDSRYDQVLERLKSSKPLTPNLKAVIESRVFVAGSVWSEDLAPVLSASTATYREHPHTLFVVPHEISNDFLNEVESAARSLGIAPREIIRFSKLPEIEPSQNPVTFRMVIVDVVGFLAELYQLGEIAFVGGSFRKTVHSVMEPLAAGSLTIVGPLHTNNREAIEFQTLSESGPGGSRIQFVTAVRDAAEFTASLRSLWKAAKATDYRPQIRSEVARRGGATAFVMRWLRRQQ